MNRPRLGASALLVACLFCANPASLLGCACCSEEGQHLIWEGKPSDQHIFEMSHFKFGPTAELYVGPGDKEDAKGLRDPSYSYSLGAAFDEATAEWKWTFRDESGNTGALRLPIKSSRATESKIDIHDGGKSAGGGPLLYKEWKFGGRARGDGIFKTGFASPANYTLILKGRGNNCDSAGDFSHWRLEIRGSKADFVFVGAFVTAEGEQPAADDVETSQPD